MSGWLDIDTTVTIRTLVTVYSKRAIENSSLQTLHLRHWIAGTLIIEEHTMGHIYIHVIRL